MIRTVLLGVTLAHLGFFAHADLPALKNSPVERVEQLGGRAFLKKGKISEIILIDKDVPSGFFSQLGDLSELTDLSLETVVFKLTMSSLSRTYPNSNGSTSTALLWAN